MTINTLKVFGERHTGTNALAIMLDSSFREVQSTPRFLSWKHRLAPAKSEIDKHKLDEFLFVITVRDPYSWLKSMYQMPYNPNQSYLRNLSFDEFIVHPFEDYENVIRMWSIKYARYIKLLGYVPNAVFVRLEDFAKNQELAFNMVEKIAGHGNFIKYKKYFSGREGETQKSQEEILSKIKRPAFSISQIKTINHYIDPSVMQYFKYKMIKR